jgi:hypothetical protein
LCIHIRQGEREDGPIISTYKESKRGVGGNFAHSRGVTIDDGMMASTAWKTRNQWKVCGLDTGQFSVRIPRNDLLGY